MQNAITYNARACFKVEDNQDYEGAFGLLRTSLLSLTALQSSLKLPSPAHETSTEECVVIVSSKYNPEVDRFFSGSFFFSLPAEMMGADGPTYRQIDHCSATCVFNMALTCHLEYEVSTSCAKRNKLLQQARVLYLTAYQLLQKYPIERTDSIVLLLMSLCSNLIDIQIELGNVGEVSFWRRILEDASFTVDPFRFVGSSVYMFFDTLYMAPGELISARAA